MGGESWGPRNITGKIDVVSISPTDSMRPSQNYFGQLFLWSVLSLRIIAYGVGPVNLAYISHSCFYVLKITEMGRYTVLNYTSKTALTRIKPRALLFIAVLK